MTAFDPRLVDRLERILAVLEDICDHQQRIAYSAKQAGHQLGDVSDSHVRTLISRGRLAKVPHLGTRVVIPHGELERFASEKAFVTGPNGQGNGNMRSVRVADVVRIEAAS